MTKQSNWAGNYEYEAVRIHHPKTVEEVQELVRQSRKIRALGTCHSFNSIADSTEDLVSLDHFDPLISLDKENLTVTVAGGIRYGELSGYLHQQGFALHNLASLPHISVAGACATATHGSGDNHGNLATAVSAMELVIADGTANRMICFKEWLLGWADLELLQSSCLTSSQLLTSDKMCTRIYLYLN